MKIKFVLVRLFLFIFIHFLIKSTAYSQVQDTLITLPKVDIFSKESKLEIGIVKTLPMNILENESDISKILRLQPNFSSVKRGGTSLDPVVRGFRNAQLMILLSGGLQIEGGCPNRMDPVTSHVDASEIHSVDAIFGPQMLMYGSAIGGVLNLNLKKAKPLVGRKLKANVMMGYESIYDGTSTSAEIMGGTNSFFWRVSAGNRNYANYQTGAGEIVNSSYQKNYYNLNLGTKILKNQEIQFQFLRSEARDVRFPALPMDETHDYTNIINVSHMVIWGEKADKSLESILYYTHVDHLMDNSQRKNYHQIVPPLNGLMRASTQVDAYTYGYASNFMTKMGKFDVQLRNELGFIQKDGTRQRVMIMDMEGLHTVSEKFDNLWLDAEKMNFALSANVSREFKMNNSRSHKFSFFLRSDYGTHNSEDTLVIVDRNKNQNVFSAQNGENFLMSAGFLYVLNIHKYTFEIGFTRAHRNPDMNELYIKRMPVGFDSYDYLGNPSLKPELNHQIDFALKADVSDKVRLGINVFASQLSSYIGAMYLSPNIVMPATQGALGVKQFANFDRAYFMGGEVVANCNFKKFFAHFSGGYTYAYIENVQNLIVQNKQVVDMQVLGTDAVPEMPPLGLLANFQYDFSKINLKPSLQFRYVHKQEVVSKSYNELQSAEYFLADISVDWKYKFAVLRVGVENIFNINYYDHLNRRVVGGAMSDKIYEPGRNFFATLRLSL